MSKTLVAIYGSPRKGGNSSDLLEAVLPAFESAGYVPEFIHPGRAGINACLGCLMCEKTGECVQKDGMAEVGTRLLAADVILFATPAYFYSLPGSAKILVDRCQALWALKYRFPERFAKLSRPGRFGFALGAGATRGKRLFEGMRLTFRYFFDAVGAEFFDMLEFRKLENPGDFRSNPENARKANEWALKAVESIRQ